jgi:glucose-1-phosphate adenylyltransferase
VRRSILACNVRVNSWAQVDDSILFEGVNVGRYAVVRNAIVDKGVSIPERARIGVDAQADRARDLAVTENGITIVSLLDEWKLSG